MNSFRLKRVYLLFATAFIFMLHLPFGFSKSYKVDFNESMVSNTPEVIEAQATNNFATKMEFLYDSLNLEVKGLSHDAFESAITGYEKLVNTGKVKRQGLITIADFTKSSAKKRLFVIDLENYKVLFNTYVAHGMNSGAEFAKKFSNLPESFQSSLGFYTTSDTYNGKNGFSMNLNGLEKGINDLADSRAIVMHGAPYANESFIKIKGYLGRSQGCPAVPETMNKPIIQKIKNGSLLFIYSKDAKYARQSKLV